MNDDSHIPCAACLSQNRPDAQFCRECGHPLQGEILCAACRAANPVGHRFCDACGNPLTPDARLPSLLHEWKMVSPPSSPSFLSILRLTDAILRRTDTRLLLALSALALAVLAQTQFSDGMVARGGILAGAAMVSMALSVRGLQISPLGRFTAATRTQGDVPSDEPSGVGIPAAWLRAERYGGIAGLILSASVAAAGLYLFPKGPPNILAWCCYVASLATALAAVPAFDGKWTAVAARLRRNPRVSVDIRALLPWIALLAILLLALSVRLYELDRLPAGMYFDEAVMLEEAVRIADEPSRTPVFLPSIAAPSFFPIPIAVVVELTGVSITTGRLVAAAFGVAGVAAVFLLARLVMGTSMGLVAAFVMAVTRWDMNWSRIGMHGITATSSAALTAYLTLRAIRNGRVSDFGLAGAALGLGMWFYAPYRIFAIVLGLMLLHALLFTRAGRRRLAANAVVMVAMALIAAAPIIQYAITDTELFFERTRVTSIFTDVPLDQAIDKARESLRKHLLMFHVEGDANGRHNLPGAPMLDFLSGALVLLGLGIAATRWRETAIIILPIWVIVMMLPGVLTLPWEAPQSLRSIAVVPAVAMLVTLAIYALWKICRSAPWILARTAAPAIVAAMLAVIAFSNIQTYFGPQARDPRVFAAFSTDERLMSEHMLQQNNAGHAIFVSRHFLLSLVGALITSDLLRTEVAAPIGIPLYAPRAPLGASVYLEPRDAGAYSLLEAYYPSAQFQEVRPPAGGQPMYYSVVMSRGALEESRGLVFKRILDDGTVMEQRGSEVEGVWLGQPGSANASFDVEWSGALHFPKPGEYVLALQGNSTAQVFLNGIPLLSNETRIARIEPAVGLHAIEVRGRVEDYPSVLRLAWQPPGRDMQPIPFDNLYHGAIRPMGLAGRFFEGTRRTDDGVPDAMRVTATVGSAFWYDPVVPEPYFAVWEGDLDVPGDGQYRFRLREIFGEMRLFIDGELVADTDGMHEGEATLSYGQRAIRLEYFSAHPPSQFQVLWQPPGQPETILPIERLSPTPQHMFRLLDAQ